VKEKIENEPKNGIKQKCDCVAELPVGC